MKASFTLVASGLAVAAAQQVGTYTAEEHPPLPIQSCTASSCVSESTSVVMDGMWRWLHKVGGYDNCMSGSTWSCGNATACAQTCAYEGITRDGYNTTYGVSTSGNELTMKYSASYSSRLFLIGPDENYRMFKMLNQEVAFDVDTATLDCGMNGALYFLEMEADGGLKYPDNKAGAKYGLGCCDGQCSKMNFINGAANQNNSGLCCAEFDLWEANKISAVYTSHPSSKAGTYMCNSDCTTITDRNGCGFNSYQNGNHTYYGPNGTFTLDTSKKLTVVTQFITSDNTATGTLVDVRRLWVQDGKVIANSHYYSTAMDSITDAYCNTTLGSSNTHASMGGLKSVGQALGRGVVMAFAIWTDGAGMTWLNSGDAGSCAAGAGTDLTALQNSGATLKFSNIRVGDLGTTYSGTSATTATPTTATPTTTPTATTTKPTTTATPTTTPTPTTGTGVPLYGQCGGANYHGSTTCAQGKCTYYNDWYSQCI